MTNIADKKLQEESHLRVSGHNNFTFMSYDGSIEFLVKIKAGRCWNFKTDMIF